jgi:hypothetical protein
VIDLEKWLHGLSVAVLFVRIRKLHVKSDRHELKRILFVLVTELLHNVKQIVLLREQLVILKMVDHLASLFVVVGTLNAVLLL